MNLFPRKYKDRVMFPENRLEVLDEGTKVPSPGSQGTRTHKTGHEAQRKESAVASPKGEILDNRDPEHHEDHGKGGSKRKVYLTTVKKDQPLKRHTRDLTKSRQGDKRDREKRVKEERDPVEECAHTTASYNTLLGNSVKKPKEERRHIAIRVVSRMSANCVPMDNATYNKLLYLLMDSADDECLQIYRQMKESASREDSTVRPDLQTFKCLMRHCERSECLPKAFQLFQEMKVLYGIQPDVNMYNIMLGFCVLKRDEQQASQLFDEMKEQKVQPNVHTYNCLMNVFSESPAELLQQMFEDMLKQRIQPNLRTYNTLMRSCQRVDDYDKAFKLFEELKGEALQPDVVTYNILIDMCRERLDYVQGDRQSAVNRRSKEQQESGMRAIAVLSLSLFNEMDEKEIRPNSFTYNALMGVLARCADLRIFTVFRAMKEDAREEEEDRAKLQGLLNDGDLQDPEGALVLAGLGNLDSNVLIDDKSGTALRGHYQRLLTGDEHLSRQSAFGVKPDMMTYQTLIVAADRMGKADTAFEIFDEMKEAGIQPDLATYIKLLNVCVLNHDTQKAIHLFDEAIENKIIPDVSLYNAFINVLAEAGDELIFEIFSQLSTLLQHLNIKPNQQTYNVLIKACTQLRRPGDPSPDDDLPTNKSDMQIREDLIRERNTERTRKAFEIYEQMCKPTSPVKLDVVTYTTLMDVCAITGDTEKARELLEDMKQRDVSPTILTYNKMMNVFVSADDESIVEIFDVLRNGDEPTLNLESYTILLNFYARRRDPAVLSLFDDMKKSGIDPDARVYNVMLSYCAELQDKRKSLKFFEELKLRELAADIHTYNALMAVFSESGDELIFKVFEEMIENNITPDKTTFSTLIKQKKGLDCLRKAGEKGLLDPHKDEKEA
eukprot:TRINITY_DN17374_c0_g1_i1.p1 TRINITY_DN17374_c0_g1~~TRINITY_DN17374_c0_g1_i1.p1  ORF type:complete len:892 (+),score=218.73 TRINITY_DN17374_c0_g1_i1:53-2728(+)